MFEITIVEETLNQESVKTVNARDLHAGLGVGRDFSNWIKARIKKYGFVQGVDFAKFAKIGESKNRTDYHLTLDMAKELSMVEKTDKGKEARRYFIRMEKQAMTQQPLISTDVELKKLEVQLALAQLNQTTDLAKEKTKQLQIEANSEEIKEAIFTKIRELGFKHS
jgi:phage anti-repressor protein